MNKKRVLAMLLAGAMALSMTACGCQMNVADSEVVASIMQMAGYTLCDTIEDSDAIFVNTCSIRDNAEQKVLSRLSYFQSLRKHKKSLVIGVLGCMAERVREQLITENGVDLVVGPDSYLDLPNLVGAAERGEKAVNVELSTTETYREVIPSRIGHNRISGFISIMRGCNNFCSYCIVPYTRGRERSREPESILGELADLKIKGFKEVTLLGQNVNSYRYERPDGTVVDFPALLALVAQSAEGMRVRFTTSHPKDMSDETLRIIAAYPNVCRHIHLPVQSGSNRILKLMNRKYTREWYLDRIAAIRRILPDCGITTDMLPKLYESYECVGTVLPEIAKELGLSENVKVAAGAGDNAAAAVATGTVGDGKCNISLGTSGTIFISSAKFGVDKHNALHAFCDANGAYHLMGCMLSAASCNKWWMDEIIGTKDYKKEQEAITKLGENHVYYLPYLMGERSPYNNPNARATFIGMTMDTTRADMTQAVLEGVAFALRDSFEVAKTLGIPIERTKICGGGAKSPLWKKIIANVLNIKVDVLETEEGPSLGGAMLAAVACGEYKDVESAAAAIVKVVDTVEPDPELAVKYEARYQQFKNIYPACKDLFDKII